MKYNILFSILSFVAAPCGATTITAVASGNWTSNSTWSCGCQPSSSDDIVIPAGMTVTINGPEILFLGPVITITVNGTLVLNNGSLQIDASDIVRINAGGKISATGITGGAVYSGVIPTFISNGSNIAGPKTITNGTLPVTLLFFKADPEEQTVRLTWASASEINFDYYRIERSTDGIDFTLRGTVPGNRMSSTRIDYSLTDDSPPAGDVYYRLEAIDMNGAISLTELVKISTGIAIRQVDVFPNPVSGNSLTARLHFLPDAGAEMVLLSEDGDFVFQEHLTPGVTEYTFTFSSSIRSGMYLVLIRTSEKTYSSRISIL